MSNLIIKTAESPQEYSSIKTIRRSVFQLEQGVDPGLILMEKMHYLSR